MSFVDYHEIVSDVFASLDIDRPDVLDEVKEAGDRFNTWVAWCDFWGWNLVDFFREGGSPL